MMTNRDTAMNRSVEIPPKTRWTSDFQVQFALCRRQRPVLQSRSSCTFLIAVVSSSYHAAYTQWAQPAAATGQHAV